MTEKKARRGFLLALLAFPAAAIAQTGGRQPMKDEEALNRIMDLFAETGFIRRTRRAWNQLDLLEVGRMELFGRQLVLGRSEVGSWEEAFSQLRGR